MATDLSINIKVTLPSNFVEQIVPRTHHSRRRCVARKAPLYANAREHRPADFGDLRVRFNGVNGPPFSDWVEVDVLGCWGTRYVKTPDGSLLHDDDNCPVIEKVHGAFELFYDEDKSSQDHNPDKAENWSPNTDWVRRLFEEQQKHHDKASCENKFPPSFLLGKPETIFQDQIGR